MGSLADNQRLIYVAPRGRIAYNGKRVLDYDAASYVPERDQIPWPMLVESMQRYVEEQRQTTPVPLLKNHDGDDQVGLVDAVISLTESEARQLGIDVDHEALYAVSTIDDPETLERIDRGKIRRSSMAPQLNFLRSDGVRFPAALMELSLTNEPRIKHTRSPSIQALAQVALSEHRPMTLADIKALLVDLIAAIDATTAEAEAPMAEAEVPPADVAADVAAVVEEPAEMACGTPGPEMATPPAPAMSEDKETKELRAEIAEMKARLAKLSERPAIPGLPVPGRGADKLKAAPKPAQARPLTPIEMQRAALAEMKAGASYEDIRNRIKL